MDDLIVAADTMSWWAFLCAVSALNVLAWVASAMVLRHSRDALHHEAWNSRRLQLLLSAGYVAGCAYRSALPVYDVQRLCLVDSWLSSVIVGRSVATIAELCFVTQWALLLRGAAQATDSTPGMVVSRIAVPLIAVAELCSWHAVLTMSNLGHVIEESIWGLCAALFVASLMFIWPRCGRDIRPLLAGCCLAGVAYVFFMFGVDVPMYWARWVADEAIGRQYLSIPQGLIDASARWVVSHRWDDWKTEVVWMSLYFSVAVWLSIGLIHLPLPRRASRA
ncbi:MAG: hypothetical protein IPH26_06945 [Sterolibacteriaceae bacterium]|uniref:Uncharacterized protein n=1 Tax=Candidatus Methylophosphatis roskildensis TaxID=2899263 RepID=A0A9D7E201_9PROT|nr:hypothetical protein [Candidatus Methylophosphatis roskildensis]MBK7235792.1 hypothetical protein [Sterolibacteriaceae bacterium]